MKIGDFRAYEREAGIAELEGFTGIQSGTIGSVSDFRISTKPLINASNFARVSAA